MSIPVLPLSTGADCAGEALAHSILTVDEWRLALAQPIDARLGGSRSP